MTTDTQLDTLEARGLIGLAAIDPELEYLFRHWLVQDAAYGSLLKQERHALHARVGAALEELYPDRREELAAVLAMHFEQAGEMEKATTYYLEAGRNAQRRNAIREAFAAFDRAAALMPPASSDDDEHAVRRRVEIQLGRAEAGFSFRNHQENLDDLEAAIREVERVSDPQLIARAHMLAALNRLLRGADAADPFVTRSLARLGQIADEAGDPSLHAMPLALIGMNRVFTGGVAQGVRDLEEAVPVLEGTHDQIGAAFARGSLAMGYATLGRFTSATTAARQASKVAERGDVVAQLDALIAEAMVRSNMGEIDKAIPIAEACVARSEEAGAAACAMVSAWVLGDAYHRAGRLEEARAALERSSAISRVVHHQIWGPLAQAWRATTATAMGDVADRDWDEALAVTRSIGNRMGEAAIIAKRGEAAATRGQWEAAFADFAAAAAVLEEEGARPSLGRLLHAWGETLRAAGREAEGEAMTRRSDALFEEIGIGSGRRA